MRPGLAGGHRVRAVVDVNVLISGVLSAKGPSAEILRANRDGLFELAISETLLERAQPNSPPSEAAQADPSGERHPARQLDPRPRNPRPGSARAPRRSAPATPTTTTSSPSRSTSARTS